ncbi:metal-sulfur cluster assembly factor [Labrys wisconsinensis]|uniref:Metal-sulfur cluster biosynthetic enzyme n=1 Tax=Labrys wisconsinensis TaxID=425677 RepID=A0ABU0JP79_9HYPH|nr:iron-sulfur cluster assembly protein [Labrys wisconsinensis]MDQ0475094.1 metal-sulfur cluster biosynthetic enzyme [Labrys wisconsinensis]
MGRAWEERRVTEVRQCLASVTDPELDEPVTDLGFVEEVTVDARGGVDITFRLPTYWCSANFAFLMADDMRRAVSALPWVEAVRPQLQDHMAAEEINRGVRLGLSFGQAFTAFASGDSLGEIREKFRRKAFERRQEAVIQALRAAGLDNGAICAMTLATFDAADLGAGEGARQKPRYREALIERGLAAGPHDRAFVTFSGRGIEAHELGAYLQRLRAVRINMEFNTALCRGLLGSRYQDGAEVGGCGHGCGGACPKPAAAVPQAVA